MNPQPVRTVLRDAIARVAPDVVDEVDSIDADVDLFEEFDLDSMDRLAVMEAIATSTGVDIPESAYARLTTIDAISQHLAAAPS